MLRRTSFVFGFVAFLLSASSTFAETLTVYTYDSFASKGGIGSLLAEKFRAKTGADLKFIAPGDALQAVGEIERDASVKAGVRGDAVVGIDLATFGRMASRTVALPGEVGALRSALKKHPFLSNVPANFLPFDYGYFAFIENRASSARLSPAPTRWADFFTPAAAKKLLLEDPRTSTPGLGFVLLIDALYGKASDVAARWLDVRRSTLTLAPGWSQAYGLFLKGEAPYVWSYTTSEAYHLSQHETWYRAVILPEGHPVQVEGAALLRDTPLARAFLTLLLSPEIQTAIPTTQWMYPVRETKLPGAFESVREPARTLEPPAKASDLDRALATWKSAVSGL